MNWNIILIFNHNKTHKFNTHAKLALFYSDNKEKYTTTKTMKLSPKSFFSAIAKHSLPMGACLESDFVRIHLQIETLHATLE